MPYKDREKQLQYYRDRYLNKKEYILKINEQWRQNNIEQDKQNKRSYHLKRFYGISCDAYNKMAEDQDYKCAICRKECNVWGQLSVDHNHNTHTIRGLLCHHCNAGMGHFRDDPKLLQLAIRYLNDG